MGIGARLRQDPVLLAAIVVMALGILVAVGLMVYWTVALIPTYPPNPCAPDGQREAAIWLMLTSR